MTLKRSLMRTFRAGLPPLVEWRLRLLLRTYQLSKTVPHHAQECNACGHIGYLGAGGWPVRPHASCRQCGSLERHRLLKLWLDREGHGSRLRILHFAPEPIVTSFLKPLASSYVTADIVPGRGDLTLNIEKLDLPEDSFDWIVCNHVLEHVDDRAALAEMYRILPPGGLAAITTPVIEGWTETYENPAVQSDAERVLHFGQADHVRYFGADVRERIRAPGFDLSEFVAVEPDVSRYGLVRADRIFLARKT